MSFLVLRTFEYGFFCDNKGCNDFETLHTGDEVEGIRVHDTQTAFKASHYHRSKGKVYCDSCFKKIKKSEVTE